MILPGGIVAQGGLQRRFSFRPPGGHLEMALAASVAACPDLPSRVSAALQVSLAGIGEVEPDAALVDGLCVGDRQYLMTRLAGHLGLGSAWFSTECGHCRASFDFFLDLSALPAKQAGPGYPFSQVQLSCGTVRLRVPTGADQRAILSTPDEAAARQELARRCLVDRQVELTADDILRIETALEELAPELATHVSAPCPECGGDNVVEIDPYYCLGRAGSDLLLEVHQLAAFYHWSEEQILDLPRWRRRAYLQLVDRSRGVVT